MIKKSVSIDFSRRVDHPIALEKRSIRLPRPKSARVLGIKLFEPKIDIKWHRLWLELETLPPAVEAADPYELFLIKSFSQTSPSMKDFKIDGGEFPFEILFMPTQILDYRDHENPQATVRAKLLARFKPDSQVKLVEEYEVELSFVKAQPDIIIDFHIEPGMAAGMEHRKDPCVELGVMSIETRAPVRYTQPLNCVAHVKFDESHRWDLVGFSDGEAISQSNPIRDLDSGLRGQDERLEPDTSLEVASANKIVLENLLPGNRITLPVYVDLNRLENPHEPADYSASAFLEQRLGEKEWVSDAITRRFHLLPDSRRTELKVQLVDDERMINLANHEHRPLSFPLTWTRGKRGSVTCFSLVVGNHAENGEGAVCIRDFNIHFALAPQTNSSIQTFEDRPFDQVFSINGAFSETLTERFDFPNDVSAQQTLDIAFRHDAIREIPQDIATLCCKINFRYLELDGRVEDYETLNWDGDGVRLFEAKVFFKLEQNLGPHWLALDFGTSATVAAFGDDSERLDPLNLQKPLQSWLLEQYQEHEIQEFGTHFLASSILLRYGGAVHAQAYRDDLIYLSPPYSDIAQDIGFNIPYLKSIVGLEHVPNPGGKLDSFQYKLFPDDENMTEFTQQPLRTRTLLTNAYRLLLRDFVSVILRETRQDRLLNKIVVTIPNTFTPRHADFVRNLIGQEFEFLRKDLVTFVSESDAIAYFYLSNWTRINRERAQDEQNRLLADVEYALVYDMGAGTLDLTYLRIETKGDGSRTVRILGRLGKNTAGNYLDYIIAKYIHDRFHQSCITPVFGRGTGRQKEAQVELKRYIREKIKPNLDSDQTFELHKELREFKFAAGTEAVFGAQDLRNSPQVQSFLEQNTGYLFDHFFNLFNNIDGRIYGKGQIPLDTVIFSGRSIQFKALKQAIKTQLAVWTGGDRAHDADLGDPGLGLNADTLKSAVVQGALKYALAYRDRAAAAISVTNHNLMARYGIAYRDPRRPDVWRFKELLNPSTRPINEASPVFKDGMTIYRYDTDRYDADPNNNGRANTVDLSATTVGYFVQSYSRDTEGDLNRGHHEYLTLMSKFHPGGMGPGMRRKARVQITIDENNEMTTHIGREVDDPQAPLRVDIDKSHSFKNSMWPYWDEV